MLFYGTLVDIEKKRRKVEGRSLHKSLAKDYYERACIRLAVVELLCQKMAYADAIRETQEALELALKGLLRSVGIEPPKWHDVGKILVAEKLLFNDEIQLQIESFCLFSGKMRRERELSFYGEEDFLPSEQYTETEAIVAFTELKRILQVLSHHFSTVI